MLSRDELVRAVLAYNPRSDSAMLARAYDLAKASHEAAKQIRADGSPYFEHPAAAAEIIMNLRLDDATIAATLLHDVIEDTETPPLAIREACGEEVLKLVQGVTKISTIAQKRKEAERLAESKPSPRVADAEKIRQKQQEQAENLRKLIMAVSEDIRVLLVKLADRMHNMRTIHFLRPDKRARIARETMDIYAPLAGRMGIQAMREELEDLCFRVLNPSGRRSIYLRLAKMRRDFGGRRDDIITPISEALNDELKKAGLAPVQVYGRMKRPFSIWRKMHERGIDEKSPDGFQQLSDVVGFRAIMATPDDCYRALGAIHRRWSLIPGRFKDYISLPKTNGYRSLHTTVMLKREGGAPQRVEVQIRTPDMHSVAEAGVAAHWAYREGKSGAEGGLAPDLRKWLDSLASDIDGDATTEAVASAKLSLYHDKVFCFTPRGEVKALPQDATLLDFAYAIHTDLGNGCVGGRVNGVRATGLAHVLKNGDMVEVSRSENQRPQDWWLDHVKTGRARSAIQRALDEEMTAKEAIKGERLVRLAYKSAGLEYDARDVDEAVKLLGRPSRQKLLAEISKWDKETAPNLMSAPALVEYLHPGHIPSTYGAEERPSLPVRLRDGEKGGLLGRRAFKLAPCCKPIPGDPIYVLPHEGGGFMAHRRECPVLTTDEDNADHWEEADWDEREGLYSDHLASLKARLRNNRGALARFCQGLADRDANIDDIWLTKREATFYELRVNVETRSVAHLETILSRLASLEDVESVERIIEADEDPEQEQGSSRKAGPAQQEGGALRKDGRKNA